MQGVDTSEGRVLQIYKMHPNHPQYHLNKLHLLFKIQTSDQQQPYIITYQTMRNTKRDMLLDYYAHKVLLRPSQKSKQHHISQINSQQDEIEKDIDENKLANSCQIQMEEQLQIKQPSTQTQRNYYIAPIRYQQMHTRPIAKSRPKCITQYLSGCYDVLYQQTNHHTTSTNHHTTSTNHHTTSTNHHTTSTNNIVFDFDQVLEQIGIAPYCSYVYFEPVIRQQHQNAKPIQTVKKSKPRQTKKKGCRSKEQKGIHKSRSRKIRKVKK